MKVSSFPAILYELSANKYRIAQKNSKKMYKRPVTRSFHASGLLQIPLNSVYLQQKHQKIQSLAVFDGTFLAELDPELMKSIKSLKSGRLAADEVHGNLMKEFGI